ncbi:dTDP-4-dehydrorhamnose reductase [Clostridium beijerinckii]|uniref:dTDP-4-dehydrorhamnose reductase n=1 Tax=Clostridium beijerinckii TaxID=1520 RepID=UPI00098C3115|nr:dTDP-4-dehydrorhamnose reductase [Clostridium beijerinckii]MBA8933039.1 dTDP-4-dehydrorhamnose reductase [Clostridium beijerinckii]NRT79387.1 dTDP-4-dehydrorhamnose reductase [Clostridium beijerinckii]NRU37242.1 dTDP-4-dehydrorhamnose reductase [Clostridium beijerinckii]NSA99479.1 dTDP-4-dehydrorhamnose reductase [Clostridium beijerinckii]OOM49121.1 dTDP-4-dehydrorhamnose reductase [Clostridium beijerinckii]
MNILITGANGQLGQEILHLLKNMKADIGYVDEAYKNANIKALNSRELDITDFEKVKVCVSEFKPELIINCAAFTNVDKCETDRETALKVNAIGPQNLAIAAEEISAKLMHVSTDYVFSGDYEEPLTEYDLPSPSTTYGKTKLLGEAYIREQCSKYFIFRTAWLYGRFGKNFVYTIMNAAKEKGYLEVVNDQTGCPTNAEDLAYQILEIALTEGYGIYHCTGEGKCTWYDFAKKIIEFSEIECQIKPITSENLNRPAKRPIFSALENMMLNAKNMNRMRNWEEALKEFIKLVK